MREEEKFPEEGRSRVVIENVAPQIDDGRRPIKRIVGERVLVGADIFADGHDLIAAAVKYQTEPGGEWTEAPMLRVAGDRWRGEFTVEKPGAVCYTIVAWIDRPGSWLDQFRKKFQAGQNVSAEILEGARLAEEAARRAGGAEGRSLGEWARDLAGEAEAAAPWRASRALDERLAGLAAQYADRRFATTYDRLLRVVVDPARAVFSAWYEMFPRSLAAGPGGHGTFGDCERHLARIAEMGFDILYLPPIHPIGRTLRKGRNNNPAGEPGEPGSPWGIGAREGGHKAVHPDLGTMEDFRRLVERARALGLEVALDVALHCSPDHPYVTERPDWFRHRPDGSIRPAENPPKKYEDIYPFDFECADWKGLWTELKSIFDFWIQQGVRVFRVDNPHTKPLGFWEWCVAALKRENPDLILLAEAFTRPAVMYGLAKRGFTQSYTYFPWRNSREELTDYLGEVTGSPLNEFFRPNHWPNTPDILTHYLQAGGRPAFAIRFLLAATLGANYGIYGPAFELGENTPLRGDAEEYLNSEKFEIRRWDVDAPESLRGLIARVNRIRRENRALQSDRRLRFHPTTNERLLAYSKSAAEGDNTLLVVVNLDPDHTHSGWVDWPVEQFVRRPGKSYQMHDLLTDARYIWNGGRNYVQLSPQALPAHILRLREHARTEHDFDYYT